MTIAGGQAEDSGDALAADAAHWFARMRGPDAEASRAAFEAWLAQGPEHRAAYNRAAEIFAMGKLLVEPETPNPAPARRRRAHVLGLATAAACVVGIGGWVVSHPPRPAPARSEADAGAIGHRTIVTTAGEIRVVRLADGSTVRLGEQTVLAVDIDGQRRDLALQQGQARFEVAHEARPFVVHAGGGSVTARGTVFEVALLRPGKVAVRLLRGAVDVALPRQAASAPPTIRKLAAGDSVSFAAQPDSAAAPTAPAPALTDIPPSAAPREFQATPVADLIALANQGAVRPIRLADASLGDERVSGRFRIDDTELLARRLGALFGREVDVHDPHAIVLGVASAARHAAPLPPGASIERRH